jgi:hypothetical protein
MQAVLRLETTVLPGHRLEVSSPELPEGAKVEVIVVLPEQPVTARRSMLEFLASLPPRPSPLQDAGRGQSVRAGGARLMGALTVPISGLV